MVARARGMAARCGAGCAVTVHQDAGHFKIVCEIEIVLSNHDRMSLHLYLSPRSISLKVTSVGVLKGLGSRWIEIVPFTDFHRRCTPRFSLFPCPTR